MSTATFTTLGAPGGTVPTETLRRGSAKARLNLNGSGTIAIRDSFNTSSVTDNGAGDYTQNFTSAFSTVNYSPVVSPLARTDGRGGVFCGAWTGTTGNGQAALTVSGFRIGASAGATATVDAVTGDTDSVFAAIYGEIA